MRKIRLAFKYVIKLRKEEKEIIDDLLWHCAKVYNILNYDICNNKEKVNLKGNLNVESGKIYKKYRTENWHSKYLHSHCLQETIIDVIRDNKSYIALKEEYEKSNNSRNKKEKIEERIKGKPRSPRYKKEGKIQLTFTKYAIRKEGRNLKLSLSKEIQEKYKVKSLNFLIGKKLEKLVDFSSIKMIRIKKKEKEKYEIEIIYEKECKKKMVGNNILSIDLGMNNLATCVTLLEKESVIISGRTLKSKIGYINKEIRRLQGIQMRMTGSKKYKNTKKIKKLYEQRKNYSNTYMHKASREIINLCLQTFSNKIVIGDIKNIKQEMKNNQNFVEIPIQRLVEKIKYKAELEGIKVEIVDESYTSGVSAIDREEVNKENYDIGRRIERGLFKTQEGKLINADVNGSINILRKYIKSSSPNLEIEMDNGREQRPLRKRVA